MTGRSITAIQPLKDPDLVAICNDKNEIMVYSISMHRPLSAVKVSDSNVGQGDGFVTYPLYYCGFLNYNKSKTAMPRVDISALHIPES